MGSRTNPNTCARCESPLTATYTYARGCAEPHVHWSCPLCDATPPQFRMVTEREAREMLSRSIDRIGVIDYASAEDVARLAGTIVALHAPADDASGAGAMREACAKVCLRAADECPGTEDEVATWREASMWCVNAIRALPLPPATGDATRVPARDDAVEEAARALIESVPPDFWNNDPPTDDTEVAYAIDYALLDALRAALRREKGGDK